MGTITLVIDNATLEPEDFEDLCDEFLDILMDLTPVDTGYCQDAWSITNQDDKGATFYNSAEYSSYLDEGWSDQAPNGITGPALDELDNLADKYNRSI